MKIRASLVAAAAAISMFSSTSGQAATCALTPTQGGSKAFRRVTTIVDQAKTFYIDTRDHEGEMTDAEPTSTLFTFIDVGAGPDEQWGYEETNGVPGLQTGGMQVVFANADPEDGESLGFIDNCYYGYSTAHPRSTTPPDSDLY